MTSHRSSAVVATLLAFASLSLNACTIQSTPSNNGSPSSSQGSSSGNAAANPPSTDPNATGLSCRQILECVQSCADNDDPCLDACGNKGSEDGKSKAVALAECATQASCEDAACIQTNCADSLNACVGPSTNANANPTPNPNTDPDPNASGPVVATMHAAALVREFQENSVRANKLYAGKRVRVFGTVNSVSPDDDKTALVFKSSVTTSSHLFCRFTNDKAPTLADLNTGDEATAEGTVIGIGGFTNGRLILENCTRQ